MASIATIGATPTQLPPLPAAQAVQGLGIGATSATPAGDTSGDTTTYVTNADGTTDVTTTNAKGQIIETSTQPAPAAAATGGGIGLARGSLVNQIA